MTLNFLPELFSMHTKKTNFSCLTNRLYDTVLLILYTSSMTHIMLITSETGTKNSVGQIEPIVFLAW